MLTDDPTDLSDVPPAASEPPASPSPELAELGLTTAETHCATLFFTGAQVVKFKKPLDLGFADFRLPEARRLVCHREVELNRRFAPDVYLGVAAIGLDGGKACDWGVVMRRMPSGRRLSTLVSAGVDVSDSLRDLARQLAAHHAMAWRSSRIDRAGSPEALLLRWNDNIEALRAFGTAVLSAEVVAEIGHLAANYVAGRRPLLMERVTAGRIRDGHGDLLADDIFCLDDGARALDCLEFDDDLRAVDGLDDAACLAMDLERLGARAQGERFINWFAEFSGQARVDSLIHQYIAYRAVVRCKVSCLRWDQDGDPQTLRLARRFAGIALGHLRAGQPRMILVGGTPGTGKSTVAGRLADQLGAVLLRSDRIRKEQAEIPVQQHAGAGWQDGLYAPSATHDTYDRIITVAGQLLSHGESVILDASWSTAGERAQARLVAADTFSTVLELRCTTPPQVADTRIRHRQLTDDPSDATPQIARLMEREFQPWPEAGDLDNTRELDQTLDQAARLARACRPAQPPTN